MSDESLPASITLRDIAKSLGISHVTVSLALRNSAQVSSARRKQIHDKAQEMGYRPNPMAAALGQMRFGGKPRAISSELAWINLRENPKDLRRFKEFDLYWQGAYQTAEYFGYKLEEFACGNNFSLTRLENILLARGVHGILIPPHSQLPPDWDSFHWEHFSAVRFGHSIPRPRIHVVTSDQITNSLLAFAKIQSKGYKRIGYVSSRLSSTRHLAGFLMAQSNLSHGQQLAPLIFTSEGNAESHRQFVQWLKKSKPDAILTDIAALREMLRLARYRVPDDVGLAVLSVLDGNADAGIYQNPEEIGNAAVEMLISLISHNHTGIPKICRELLIEGEWVDGTTLPSRLSKAL